MERSDSASAAGQALITKAAEATDMASAAANSMRKNGALNDLYTVR
jgi:hypothetical protein